MHKNIKTVAGCLSRITCDITAPENVDTTLTAFLVYEGESRPATLESADVIIFPAVPYGHYAYEIRCGGKPVAFGHLLVRPSAFPHTDGVVDYSLAVDLSTAEAAHVELTLTPGPRGPKGEPGASAYDIAALNGYQGSEAEWIAELQGAQAAASAAKASEQAAATSAASAATTLNAAAKKTENNTFTGTNTFNGAIVANGGVNGLTGPAGWGSAVSLLGARFGAFVGECLQRRIATSFAVKSGNGTLASNKLTVAAGEQALAYSPLVWKVLPANYSALGALWVPLRKGNSAATGKCRVCVNLCCSLRNYTVQEKTMEMPIFSYAAGSLYTYAHYNVIEFSIEYGSNGQQVVTLLSPIVNANNEMTGMREQRAVVSGNNLGYNYIGLMGFLIVRTATNAYEVFAVTEENSCKIYKCGSVWAKNELYAGEGTTQKLYIGVTNGSWVLPTELVQEAALPFGVYASMAAQVAQATGTPTVTDYTFEDFNAKYGITATE